MTDTTTAPPAPAPAPSIVVRVENWLHGVELEVEAGWKWVEGEFTYLKTEAEAAFNWVKNEDPQLAALVRQLFLGWESAAAASATAGAGALGNLITAEGATIETGVANFAQGVLGKLGAPGAGVSKEAITLLFSQGETVLLNLVKSALAKVLGGLMTPQA